MVNRSRIHVLALFLLASSVAVASQEQEPVFRVQGNLVAAYPFTDNDFIIFEGPVTLRRRLDSTGQYSLDGLRLGRYRIHLTNRGHTYTFEHDLRAATRLDFTLETFGTFLDVVDGETGEALHVHMTLEKTGGPQPSFENIDGFTGGHGLAGLFTQLWGLPRGHYRLTLGGEDYYTRSLELSVPEDLTPLKEVRLKRKPVSYDCPEPPSLAAIASDRDRAVLQAALAYFATRFPKHWDNSQALPGFPFELHMLVNDRTSAAPVADFYPSAPDDEVSEDGAVAPLQRAFIKVIASPLFRQFRRRATIVASIQGLSPSPRYRLICADKTNGHLVWRRFPKAAGIIRLSLPGFSTDGNRALTYLESDNTNEGRTGRIMYLEKTPVGSWKVLWDLVVWPLGC
jgi:hypothetical protein